jgi:hypothetical protein
MIPIRTTGAAAAVVELVEAAGVLVGAELAGAVEGAGFDVAAAVVVGATVVVGAAVVTVGEGELLWLLQAERPGNKTARHKQSDNTNHQTFFLNTYLPP